MSQGGSAEDAMWDCLSRFNAQQPPLQPQPVNTQPSQPLDHVIQPNGDNTVPPASNAHGDQSTNGETASGEVW